MRKRNEKFNFTFNKELRVRDGIQVAHLSVYYVESSYDRKYPPGRELFDITMQRNTGEETHGRTWYGFRIETCNLDNYQSITATKLLTKIVSLRNTNKGLNLKSILGVINGTRLLHSTWVKAENMNGSDYWFPARYKKHAEAFRTAQIAGILN